MYIYIYINTYIYNCVPVCVASAIMHIQKSEDTLNESILFLLLWNLRVRLRLSVLHGKYFYRDEPCIWTLMF